jgi:hypothetical protein
MFKGTLTPSLSDSGWECNSSPKLKQSSRYAHPTARRAQLLRRTAPKLEGSCSIDAPYPFLLAATLHMASSITPVQTCAKCSKVPPASSL